MSIRKVGLIGLVVLGVAAAVVLRAVVGHKPPATVVTTEAPGEDLSPAPYVEGTEDEAINPADYTYNTDEAIALFEQRVKAYPSDYTSFVTLGDLFERKARETDDLACFAHAEEALRTALEILPDNPRA